MSRLPTVVRGRVMAEAVRKREPAPRTGPHAQVYAHAVAALDALLRDLSPDEWTTRVIHQWDVQHTVVHLMAGDGALCVAADVPEAVPVPRPRDGRPFATANVPGQPSAEWAGRSRYVLSRHFGRPYRETWDAWLGQARGLLAAPAVHGPLRTRLEYAGKPMALADAYLARGFETWLHGDDIARAVGRVMPEPLPETMPTLVALGLAMLAHAPEPPPVRLTLTGPGATTAQYGGTRHDAELTMSTSDFCRLLGGNRGKDEVMVEVAVEVRGGGDTASRALDLIASMAIL